MSHLLEPLPGGIMSIILLAAHSSVIPMPVSVGPITHVESYGQVHKSWRTGSSCLPFGNCKCYYSYLVKS